VADSQNHRLQYFTSTGSFLGKWGSLGAAPGKFQVPTGVAVAPDGTVFVADLGNFRIQYFTPTGSFLGTWGKKGDGPGEFDYAYGVAVSPGAVRVYTAEMRNHRVQYFRKSDPAVSPTSLGRVKALFN